METGWAVKNLLPGRRLFTRGESIIAPVGFAILAVVLMVMTASVVWVFQAQRMSYRAARAAQVRAMGSLLAHTSEVMLRGGEVSALRSLVAEAAQAHDLDACRITLPDGRVVADADPRKIALQKLPARWSGTPGQSETTSVKNGVFTLTIPLSVAGRGAASLVLSTGLEYPWSRHWEMAAGLGAIGVVALGLVLLVSAASVAIYLMGPESADDLASGKAGVLGIGLGQVLTEHFAPVGAWLLVAIALCMGLMLTADNLVLKLPGFGKKVWQGRGRFKTVVGALRPGRAPQAGAAPAPGASPAPAAPAKPPTATTCTRPTPTVDSSAASLW